MGFNLNECGSDGCQSKRDGVQDLDSAGVNSKRQFDLNEVEVGEESDECEEVDGGDMDDGVEAECGSGSSDKSLPAPAVGMVFDSWEELDNFYNCYGEQEGFGVVRASSAYKTGSKERRNVLWTCECYGRPGRRRNKSKATVTDSSIDVGEGSCLRPGNSRKCDCPVSLFASVEKDGKWVIRRVVNDHKNHTPLSPRKTRFIHKFRKRNLTSHVKRRLLNDMAVGIPLSQVHSSLAEQFGGVEELGVMERDLRNCAATEKRLKMEDGDVEAMLAYFRKMTADNQNFFHMHRLDKGGHLQDILWVDARSRAAFEDFGDVVCFDATYLTNKYHLPFANFIGVNHHGQSILLGCALISHETTETYEWVFSTWKHCMAGKAPGAILTDQAPAMRRALSTVMPESTHRWCLWHITSKFSNKLKYYPRYEELVPVLMDVIYDSNDIAEFDRRWSGFIEEFDLGADEWLAGLYDERHMWVPAYMKHLFWAGMKTTQRVESINSFFDKFIDKDTRLHEFAPRYCRAMEMRADAELEEDAKSSRNVRQLAIGTKVERTFQKLYTDKKFKEVQREIARLCVVLWKTKVSLNEHITEHTIQDRLWLKLKNSKKEIPTDERRYYTVTFDSRNNDVSCTCKNFDSAGIMCRHMLCVYEYEGVKVVPEKYILRRWRKDVQRKHSRVKVAYHDPGKSEEVKRFNKLLAACDDVCFKASLHEENVALVTEMLQLLSTRIDENNMRLKGGTEGGSIGDQSAGYNDGFVFSDTPLSGQASSLSKRKRVVSPAQGSCPYPSPNPPAAEKVKDPPIPKKVGRPRKTRLVSAAEIAATKSKKKKSNNNGNKGKGKAKGGPQTVANNKGTRTRRSNKEFNGSLDVIHEDSLLEEVYRPIIGAGGELRSDDSHSYPNVLGNMYSDGRHCSANGFGQRPAMPIFGGSSNRNVSSNLGYGFTRRIVADDGICLSAPTNLGLNFESHFDRHEDFLDPLLHELSDRGNGGSCGYRGNVDVNLALSI